MGVVQGEAVVESAPGECAVGIGQSEGEMRSRPGKDALGTRQSEGAVKASRVKLQVGMLTLHQQRYLEKVERFATMPIVSSQVP